MYTRQHLVAASMLGISLLWSSSATAQTRYRLRDLGTLPTGVQSRAYGLNDAGQVVGASQVQGTTQSRIFLWQDGVMQDLGVLDQYSHAWGADLNEAGVVAATSIGAGGLFAIGRRPVIHDGAGLVDLGFGHTGTYCRAIDDSGRVVGAMTLDEILDDHRTSHAFLWDGRTARDLGTLGGTTSQALGLNESGEVVGGADIEDDRAYHAFLFRQGRMLDLGTLGGRNSEARAIDRQGTVVGWAEDRAGARQAFAWIGGLMIPLGTLGGLSSEAHAISDARVVVGTSRSREGEPRAFVADLQRGGMQDLNELLVDSTRFVVQEARDVNEHGQIVGWGKRPRGEVHACLLEPID